MIVYLICETDKYELPVHLCENIRELRLFLQVNEVGEYLCGKTRFGLKVEKVEIDEKSND